MGSCQSAPPQYDSAVPGASARSTASSVRVASSPHPLDAVGSSLCLIVSGSARPAPNAAASPAPTTHGDNQHSHQLNNMQQQQAYAWKHHSTTQQDTQSISSFSPVKHLTRQRLSSMEELPDLSSTFFHHVLSHTEYNDFITLFETQEYQPNDTIYMQGCPQMNHFYMIKSGDVCLQVHYDSVKGEFVQPLKCRQMMAMKMAAMQNQMAQQQNSSASSSTVSSPTLHLPSMTASPSTSTSADSSTPPTLTTQLPAAALPLYDHSTKHQQSDEKVHLKEEHKNSPDDSDEEEVDSPKPSPFSLIRLFRGLSFRKEAPSVSMPDSPRTRSRPPNTDTTAHMRANAAARARAKEEAESEMRTLLMKEKNQFFGIELFDAQFIQHTLDQQLQIASDPNFRSNFSSTTLCADITPFIMPRKPITPVPEESDDHVRSFHKTLTSVNFNSGNKSNKPSRSSGPSSPPFLLRPAWCVRATTAVAFTSCVLWSVSLANLTRFFQKYPTAARKISDVFFTRIYRSMDSTPYLKVLNEEKRRVLVSMFNAEFYSRDHTVFTEGVAPTDQSCFYHVHCGTVSLHIKDERGNHKTRYIHAVDQADESASSDNRWFGEISVFLDIPRTATATVHACPSSNTASTTASTSHFVTPSFITANFNVPSHLVQSPVALEAPTPFTHATHTPSHLSSPPSPHHSRSVPAPAPTILNTLSRSTLRLFMDIVAPEVLVEFRHNLHALLFSDYHINIEYLLTNKIIYEYFLAFCEQQFCSENLEFWKASNDYRCAFERINQRYQAGKINSIKYDAAMAEMRRQADTICSLYLRDNSAKQINIEGAVQRAILSALESGPPTPTLFAPASSEVLLLLSLGIFKTFKKSRLFEMSLEKINAPVLLPTPTNSHSNTPTKGSPNIIAKNETKKHTRNFSVAALNKSPANNVALTEPLPSHRLNVDRSPASITPLLTPSPIQASPRVNHSPIDRSPISQRRPSKNPVSFSLNGQPNAAALHGLKTDTVPEDKEGEDREKEDERMSALNSKTFTHVDNPSTSLPSTSPPFVVSTSAPIPSTSASPVSNSVASSARFVITPSSKKVSTPVHYPRNSAARLAADSIVNEKSMNEKKNPNETLINYNINTQSSHLNSNNHALEILLLQASTARTPSHSKLTSM